MKRKIVGVWKKIVIIMLLMFSVYLTTLTKHNSEFLVICGFKKGKCQVQIELMFVSGKSIFRVPHQHPINFTIISTSPF